MIPVSIDSGTLHDSGIATLLYIYIECTIRLVPPCYRARGLSVSLWAFTTLHTRRGAALNVGGSH